MPDPVYTDDATIGRDAILLRRVLVRINTTIRWDEEAEIWRPTSAAFQDSPDGHPMSVDLLEEWESRGYSALKTLEGHDDFALVSITAGVARENGQIVVRAPLPPRNGLPENPAHALVVGLKGPNRQGKKNSRALSLAAQWIVAPPVAPPSDSSRSSE